MSSDDQQQGEIITMINRDGDVNPNNSNRTDGSDDGEDDDDDDDEFSEDGDDDDGDSDNDGSQSSVERMQRDFIVIDSGSEVGMSKILHRFVCLFGFFLSFQLLLLFFVVDKLALLWCGNWMSAV